MTGGLCLLLVFIVYATCSDLINVSECVFQKEREKKAPEGCQPRPRLPFTRQDST